MTQKNNKTNGNKQKSLHRWHRWVGYISLALVVILSLTGLILNRTESWNLNQITVKNRLVNALYGQKTATPPVHFSAGGHWVSWLDGRLYLDSGLIAQNTARPIGISRRDDLLIIAAEGQLALYFTDGALIETMDAAALPGRLTGIGRTEQGLLMIGSDKGRFTADSDFLSWTPIPESAPFALSKPETAPAQITEKIQQDFQGQGVSLYRLILDLHSGHIFGAIGPYLMDIAAISLIFLGITGLMKRKPNGKNRRTRNHNS